MPGWILVRVVSASAGFLPQVIGCLILVGLLDMFLDSVRPPGALQAPATTSGPSPRESPSVRAQPLGAARSHAANAKQAVSLAPEPGRPVAASQRGFGDGGRSVRASIDYLKDCRAEYKQLSLPAARAACYSAVQADPSSVDAALAYGWVLLELESTEDAYRIAYSEAQRANPSKLGEAVELMSACLVVQGNVSEAGRLLSLSDSPTAAAERRLGLLNAVTPPPTWVRAQLWQYLCWMAKGEQAADAFLRRRGFADIALWTEAVSRLPRTAVSKAEARASKACPWWPR